MNCRGRRLPESLGAQTICLNELKRQGPSITKTLTSNVLPAPPRRRTKLAAMLLEDEKTRCGNLDADQLEDAANARYRVLRVPMAMSYDGHALFATPDRARCDGRKSLKICAQHSDWPNIGQYVRAALAKRRN